MIEGMMKSESFGRSATLMSAPALFAASRARSIRPLVLARDEAEARGREIPGRRLARRVLEIQLAAQFDRTRR